MRRLWFGLIIALLLVAVPALTLRSQSAVLLVAHWAIGTFTELRLELKNPVVRVYQGIISADEVHLIPIETTGPALLSVLDLDMRTRLSDLLAGHLRHSVLSASQVLIYTSENDEVTDPQPGNWLQLIDWLPAELDIGQVHLITASENTWIFPLKNLRGQREGADKFNASALADYEGEPLEAALQLLGSRHDDLVQSVRLELAFHAPESGSRVALEGILEGREERFHYDFMASASYRDIGEFVRGLDSTTVLQGALELQARMVGNAREFVLSEASLVLDNMPSYGFEAGGELHYSRSGGSEIRLIAAGEMSNLEYLVNWLDLDITQLGRAQASVSLSGSLDAPAVDNFVLITESDNGLAVNVSGRLESLGLGPVNGGDDPAGTNEVRVDLRGPGLYVLERWIGDIAFETGPWRASWIARGDRESIQLQDIILETGSADSFKLRVEGDVDKLANTARIGLASIEGVNLRVDAFSPDSAHIAGVTGLDLPPYHQVSAKLDFEGSGELLNFENGEIEIQNSDLQATLSGVSGVYRHGAGAESLGKLVADVQVSISDTGMLSQYTDREIPLLGPARATARLGQQDSRFQLSQIDLHIEGEDLNLHSVGRIGDLQKLRSVRLQNRVRGLDIRRLLSTFIGDFDYDNALGKLEGEFFLQDRDRKWNIDKLAIDTVPSGGIVELSGAGAIYDLTGFTTANLEASLTVTDGALLEALSGLRIKPSRARLAVNTTPTRVEVEATAVAGDTSLNTQVGIGYSGGNITSIKASLHTPRLHLEDLGLQAGDAEGETYAPASEIDAEAQSRLDRLLQHSPEYPTDIRVNVDGISGEMTNVESLDIHVTGENNRYTLRQFRMLYDDALAEIRGIIDLNASPPFISLAGEALSVPLSTLSQDLGAPSDIRGRLTARGGLSASGTSSQSLTGSLDGSLAIALEDTTIQGAAYDLLATDFLAWIYSGAALQTSTHLDCTMARFDISEGVARTDSIYVESERMIATGEGSFDLPRQRMDLTITPRSRSRSFQIPSEVRLKGDISDPRVSISPISAAADASAQALLLLPKLALRLFGRGGGPSQRGVQPCQASLEN